MKKRLLAGLIAAVLGVSALAGCGGSKSASGEAKGSEGAGSEEGGDKIVIWCWDKSDSRAEMNQVFTDKTGIAVEMVAVESKDIAQKLQTTMAAGGDMPDVVWLEATYRGKLLSMDVWEDITKDPYNFDTSQMLDYLLPLETSPDGTYVGPECPSVAGMAYKRDLAKEYFGTDDPAELEAMFSDWESFKKAGEEVQKKSDGKVFMLPSLGAAGIMMKGTTDEPFIEGDKLNLDSSMAPILEELIEFKRLGVCDVLDFNSPEEGASFAGEEHIFYPCATWSLEYSIKANDKDGEGRWGFMLPPGGPFPWGGTVSAVPAKAANKEGAVEYIKFFFATEEGGELQRDYKSNFSPYKPIYEDDTFYSAEDPYFQGQDVLKEFSQRVLNNITKVREPSQYDQDIDDVYNFAVKSINASDGTDITADELITQMEDELVNKNPDITK